LKAVLLSIFKEAFSTSAVYVSSDTTLQLTLPGRSPKPHTLFEEAKHTDPRSSGSHARSSFKKLSFASQQEGNTKEGINLSLKEETLIPFYKNVGSFKVVSPKYFQ
jgi:hypothetical protein